MPITAWVISTSTYHMVHKTPSLGDHTFIMTSSSSYCNIHNHQTRSWKSITFGCITSQVYWIVELMLVCCSRQWYKPSYRWPREGIANMIIQIGYLHRKGGRSWHRIWKSWPHACMEKSDSSNKWIALNEDVPSRQASEISLDNLSKLD